MVEKWNYEYKRRIMVKSGNTGRIMVKSGNTSRIMVKSRNTSRIMGNLFIQEQRKCYECLKMSVIFADNVKLMGSINTLLVKIIFMCIHCNHTRPF